MSLSLEIGCNLTEQGAIERTGEYFRSVDGILPSGGDIVAIAHDEALLARALMSGDITLGNDISNKKYLILQSLISLVLQTPHTGSSSDTIG